MTKSAGVISALLLAAMMTAAVALAASNRLPQIGDPAPEINGKPWINSQPVTPTDLRGKVILVEFWTYG